MSGDNVIPFPSQAESFQSQASAFRLCGPRWRCPIHGVHDNCIHIATVQGDRRTYCVACVIELLDDIGLMNLPPA